MFEDERSQASILAGVQGEFAQEVLPPLEPSSSTAGRVCPVAVSLGLLAPREGGLVVSLERKTPRETISKILRSDCE